MFNFVAYKQAQILEVNFWLFQKNMSPSFFAQFTRSILEKRSIPNFIDEFWEVRNSYRNPYVRNEFTPPSSLEQSLKW